MNPGTRSSFIFLSLVFFCPPRKRNVRFIRDFPFKNETEYYEKKKKKWFTNIVSRLVKPHETRVPTSYRRTYCGIMCCRNKFEQRSTYWITSNNNNRTIFVCWISTPWIFQIDKPTINCPLIFWRYEQIFEIYLFCIIIIVYYYCNE